MPLIFTNPRLFPVWGFLLLLFGGTGELLAEDIRVAVARGNSLVVRGEKLKVGQESGGALRRHPDQELRLKLERGKISDGKKSHSKLVIEGREGSLSVQGIRLLGRLEVLVEKGKLLAIDEVDVERYVASVVGGEVPVSWPDPALQAQAIAARTYVMRRKLEGVRSSQYHVEASVLDQVYRGGASMTPETQRAAEATFGQVLAYHHQLVEAYFFSSCTGSTESGAEGLGRDLPYLLPVSCHGGEQASNAAWEKRFPIRELAQKFRSSGTLGDELSNIRVLSRTSSGRVSTLSLVTQNSSRNLNATEFRKLLGYRELPSLDFSIEKKGETLVFKGSGAGHGVGLCQWCAKAQAEEGWEAEEILKHFYQGANVLRMY